MKNKKPLIIAGVAVLLLGIGFTVAYNMDLIPFLNNFGLAKYQAEYVDTFTSPSDWKPCDTTSKTIAITNKGNVDVSARVKLSDYWKDKDGNDLADLMSGDQKLTVINFHDGWENKWDYVDGWYVYKTNLAPNETTEPLIDSVTLSCETNLAGEVNYTDNGQTGESGTSPYLGASFHIEATLQTIQADAKNEWVALYNATVNRVNSLGDYQIDFSKKAVKSDDVATANGNGVNATTEKGKTVYYYRGDVDNYVIWANYCWRIVRTTYTGGTKMLYSGKPTTVGDKRQCLVASDNLGITLEENGEIEKTFKFNDDDLSYADIGYMYGEKIKYDQAVVQYSTRNYTFSSDISRDGDIFVLNTEPGHSVRGEWGEVFEQARDARLHYFCIDGAATSCSGDEMAYVISYEENVFGLTYRMFPPMLCAQSERVGGCYIYHMLLNGHSSAEEALAAANNNIHDSNAKRVVDTWFEQANLTNREDELEDAIFCNDRSMEYDGSEFVFASYTRKQNRTPTYECADKNDAFTKDDETNGNSALKYKIGLLSMDEVMMAALHDNGSMWLTTPSREYCPLRYARFTGTSVAIEEAYPDKELQLRPVVSLKSGTTIKSGDGQKTNPYIVE